VARLSDARAAVENRFRRSRLRIASAVRNRCRIAELRSVLRARSQRHPRRPSPSSGRAAWARCASDRPGSTRRARLKNSGSTLNPSSFPPSFRYWRSSTGTPARGGSISETLCDRSSRSNGRVSGRAANERIRRRDQPRPVPQEALRSRNETISSRDTL
jgi:hypothetical protein